MRIRTSCKRFTLPAGLSRYDSDAHVSQTLLTSCRTNRLRFRHAPSRNHYSHPAGLTLHDADAYVSQTLLTSCRTNPLRFRYVRLANVTPCRTNPLRIRCARLANVTHFLQDYPASIPTLLTPCRTNPIRCRCVLEENERKKSVTTTTD